MVLCLRGARSRWCSYLPDEQQSREMACADAVQPPAQRLCILMVSDFFLPDLGGVEVWL